MLFGERVINRGRESLKCDTSSLLYGLASNLNILGSIWRPWRNITGRSWLETFISARSYGRTFVTRQKNSESRYTIPRKLVADKINYGYEVKIRAFSFVQFVVCCFLLFLLPRRWRPKKFPNRIFLSIVCRCRHLLDKERDGRRKAEKFRNCSLFLYTVKVALPLMFIELLQR